LILSLARLLILHLGINYLSQNKTGKVCWLQRTNLAGFKTVTMKKYQLGEFEEVVMLTVGILYKDAYGVSIKKEIESRLKRGVSVGALQTALKRLEDKGYLKSYDGETTEERAGRPKKYFQITALGKKAMEYSKSTREELWNAIPKVAWEIKIVGSRQ
jgi:PadR family transcriptional regulator, regulatory protein PadR